MAILAIYIDLLIGLPARGLGYLFGAAGKGYLTQPSYAVNHVLHLKVRSSMQQLANHSGMFAHFGAQVGHPNCPCPSLCKKRAHTLETKSCQSMLNVCYGAYKSVAHRVDASF